MSDVTREGARLIAEWMRATEAVKRCRMDLNRAECDEKNAQLALGKWLMPDDAKVGEKIAVWEGTSLFQGEKLENGDVAVTIRTRGKDHYRLREAS